MRPPPPPGPGSAQPVGHGAERPFHADLEPTRRTAGLGLVRDELRAWLAESGVAAAPAAEIVVAAGEACVNVLEHSGARRSGEQPAGWIEARVEPGWVRVVVVDRGRWVERDPATFARRNRGRGRLVMAALMNRVTVLTGADGTTVTLLKQLPPPES